MGITVSIKLLSRGFIGLCKKISDRIRGVGDVPGRCKGGPDWVFSRGVSMNESKAKVFVSSTIYDFRDLRSAFKLWLQEYGYEVLLSDLNDFPQLPNENSYESCLRAIDRSDYFVLFVGTRVGGWYDRGNNISITRMEYQHAYERYKQGKLKLLLFVRQEIWDIREDRQALKRFLEAEEALGKELSAEDKEKLVNHSSKFLNDANFVIDFLHEIGRNTEMKQALKGDSEFPGANWIYRFSSFRDIIDASRTVLDLSGNLRKKALRTSLVSEIEGNLAEVLGKENNGLTPLTTWSKYARERFSGGFNDKSTYRADHLIWLGMFLLTSGQLGKRFNVSILKEAIISGEFLDFDKQTGSHAIGPFQRALLDLEHHIERLRDFPENPSALELLQDHKLKTNRKAEITKDNQELVVAFAFHDLIENVISLCQAIYWALEGDEEELKDIRLHPSSPVKEEIEKIKNERPTFEEVQKWLRSQKPPQG